MSLQRESMKQKNISDNQDLNGMARIAAANQMNYDEMELREAMGAKYSSLSRLAHTRSSVMRWT